MDLLKFILVCCLIAFASSKELPDFIKAVRCKRNDPKVADCLQKAINTLRPNLIKGIPELGLPALDPLHIPSLKIDTGDTPSFKFVADLKDVDFVGARDFECSNVNFEKNGDKVSFEFTLKIPSAWISGQYKADGKVLIIQFNGGGPMSMNVTDVVVTGKLYGKAVTRKEKEYYQYDKIDLSLDVLGTFSLNFDNLLPDPAINARTNEVINENAADLYKDLKPVLGKAVGDIFGNAFNDAHRRFSNDALFLD